MQRVLQQSAHAENPVYEKTDAQITHGRTLRRLAAAILQR